MEKRKRLIHQLLMICFLILIGANYIPSLAQKHFSLLKLNDQIPITHQQALLNTLEKLNDSYLLFLENLRLYYYSNNLDEMERSKFAMTAITMAAKSGQYELARNLVNIIYNENKANVHIVNNLLIRLSDVYLFTRNGEEAYEYLHRLPQEYLQIDSIKFRTSASLFFMNRKTDAEIMLNEINSPKYTANQLFLTLKESIKKNDFPNKSKYLAATMSIILPGSGQIYTGHLFDGLYAFTFCSILGCASYAGWKYQSDHPDFLTIPIITTLAFAVFYVTNIISSIESADRYNNFYEAQYYDGVIKDYLQLISN